MESSSRPPEIHGTKMRSKYDDDDDDDDNDDDDVVVVVVDNYDDDDDVVVVDDDDGDETAHRTNKKIATPSTRSCHDSRTRLDGRFSGLHRTNED